MFRPVCDTNRTDLFLIDKIVEVPIHRGPADGRMLPCHPLIHFISIGMIIGRKHRFQNQFLLYGLPFFSNHI